MYKLKIITLLIISFLSVNLFGIETRDINIKVLNKEHGLSNQTVNCFYQDEFGFIWIGTQNGLNRYDGSHIETFLPESKQGSIVSNNIRQLCGDYDGHVYLRSLSCVEVYDIKMESFSTIYDNNKVGGIAVVEKGLLIAADNIIYLWNKESHVLSELITVTDVGKIENIVVSADETYIIFSSTIGNVYFIDMKTKLIIESIYVGHVNNLYIDWNKSIWCSTRNGIICIKDGKVTNHFTQENSDLLHNNVRSVIQFSDDSYYVATYSGLQRFVKDKNKFIIYEYDNDMTTYSVHSIMSIYIDKNKTLWMGTFYYGAQYYNSINDIFQFYRFSTSFPKSSSYNIISSMVEDVRGNIYFASEGNGLCVFNPKTKTFSKLPYYIGNSVIKSLLYDSKTDGLWVASLYDGLDYIDLKKGNVSHVNPVVYSEKGEIMFSVINIVKMISDIYSDNLLLATQKGIVSLNKKKMRLEYNDIMNYCPNDISQVWDMCFYNDALWVTTSFAIIMIDVEKNKVNYYTVNNRKNQHYNYLLKTRDEKKLFAGSTGAGIYLFDNNSNEFKYLNGSSHQNDFILGMAEPLNDSFLYIITDKGLSLMNMNNLYESFISDLNYDLPIESITSGGIFLSSDGIVYLCGLNGIVSMDSHITTDTETVPKVYINHIYVNNEKILPGDGSFLKTSSLYQKELILPPYSSALSFDLSLSGFSRPVQLEYMLEGLDASYAILNGKTISYTNLSPGKYRLIVRNKADNNKNYHVSTLMLVTIMSPFYLRPWFVMLSLAVILMICYYLWKLYWGKYTLKKKLEFEHIQKEKEDELNQNKLRFFINASHEFRTPLTLIMGQLEMLLMQKNILPSVYNRILSSYKNAKKLNYLVDEVIDIRRQEQQHLTMILKKCSLVEIINEIYLSFKDFSVFKGIELVFESDKEEIMVWVDRYQIEKVFYNLLSNAFKYTDNGGRIRIGITEQNSSVDVYVSDTGIGIPSTDLPNIFDRFWQSHDNLDNKIKGSGIGLSLSKGIVEMHGGNIKVDSILGKGTTFTVTLMKDKPKQADNIVIIDKQEVDVEQDFVGNINDVHNDSVFQFNGLNSKILIVEDNLELLSVLKQIFNSMYEVYTSTDGKSAIEVAKDIQPDIILSDVMMPVMSGIEMCSILKSDINTSHIPIVLLTARNMEEHIVEGLLTGADDYITKPFNIKILLARCNNIVTNRRNIQQRFQRGEEMDINSLIVNPKDSKLINEATIIVEKHITDQNFDVNIFARELGLSRTLLFTKIKGITGQTPNEFILTIKLKQAAAMLLDECDKSVNDIGYECGFTSGSYFIQCFKQCYGITPAKYRKSTDNQ